MWPLAGTNYNYRYWTINLKRLTECSVIVWNYRRHWDFHKDWLGFFMRNNEKEQIKTAAGSLEPSRSQLLSSHANLWPFKMDSCWAIYRSTLIENLCWLITINFVALSPPNKVVWFKAGFSCPSNGKTIPPNTVQSHLVYWTSSLMQGGAVITLFLNRWLKLAK